MDCLLEKETPRAAYAVWCLFGNAVHQTADFGFNSSNVAKKVAHIRAAGSFDLDRC
jgi:hypothetical protein